MWRAYYTKWSTVTRDRLNPDFMELVPELLGFVPPASVIDRMVYSAFGGGRLLGFLTKHHVDTLIISGGETDVCVLSTVLSAVDLGYRVILVEGALCSSSDESHATILASTVSGLISRSVLQTSNISSVCGGRPKTACRRLRDAASEARTLTPAHSIDIRDDKLEIVRLFQRADCCISIKRRNDFVTMRFQNRSQIFADQKLILDSQNNMKANRLAAIFVPDQNGSQPLSIAKTRCPSPRRPRALGPMGR